MKTLRFLGMALLAIVLSVNLTACSDDDDSGVHENGNNGLKLASYILVDDYGYFGYDFEYDGQGRICKAVYSDEESSDETIIEYNETGIIATNNSNGHKDVCTLNSKGQIVNSVCTSYGNAYVSQYIYDENGYLTTIYLGEDEKDGARFTWENGNLVKVEGYGGSITFNYNADIPFSKGSILFFSEFIDLDCDILNTLFNCGYMGKVPQNMPASMTTTNEYYSNLTEFSYEMGKDGYISKINVKENGNSVYSMTLTWE